jgi:hypothetical protein
MMDSKAEGSGMSTYSKAWRRSKRRWSWDAGSARMMSLELGNCGRGDKGRSLETQWSRDKALSTTASVHCWRRG